MSNSNANRRLKRHEIPASLKREREKAIELATKSIKHKSSKNAELLKAAANGKHEKLVQLLTKGGVDINCKDIEREDTPLHYAVVAGMRKTVGYLIRQGADPDPVNMKGQAPIHVAVYYDYASIARCLASNDADVNKKDKDGNTPISLALERNFERSFSALVEYGANYKEATRTGAVPLLEAAARGWTTGVLAICDKCEEDYLATQNAAGHTALHFAAVNGRKSVVEALLQYSMALTKVRNAGGFLAVDLATSCGHTEVADILKAAAAEAQSPVPVDKKSAAERRKTWRQSLLGVTPVGTPPPLRAGYLMVMDNRKPLKKWCELRDGILYQLDREGGKQEHLLHLFGTSVSTEEKLLNEKLGKYGFVIATPSNKYVCFGTETQDDANGWVGALKKRKANLAYLSQKTDTMNSQEFRDLKKNYQEKNANDNNSQQQQQSPPPSPTRGSLQNKVPSEGQLNLSNAKPVVPEPMVKPGSSFLDLNRQSQRVQSTVAQQSEFDFVLQGAEIMGSSLRELEVKLENHITQRLFEREWIALEEKELSKPSRELSSEALLDYNLQKNRYTNVIPYNETRVKLSPLGGLIGTDYINANYVSCGNKYFIATQAPTPATFADFYRMVWENDCKHIVMLTRFEEMGRIKAHDYLPRRGPAEIGHFLVELTSVSQPNDSYCIFGIKLTKDCESREFKQYHFVAWPDHGVADPDPLLKLINIVHPIVPQDEEDGSPVVVHCSAGIGRTGTWIAVAAFLEEFSLTKFTKPNAFIPPINLMRTISLLRSQRGGMLTTFDQYEFIYNLMLLHLREINHRLAELAPPSAAPVARTTPTPSPRGSNEQGTALTKTPSQGALNGSGNWVAASGPASPRSMERTNSQTNMRTVQQTLAVPPASASGGTVGRLTTIGSRRPTVAEDTFSAPSGTKK